jgi:Na+/proline symporter
MPKSLFTIKGGVKATARSHALQMAVMTVGLVAALVCAVVLLLQAGKV